MQWLLFKAETLLKFGTQTEASRRDQPREQGRERNQKKYNSETDTTVSGKFQIHTYAICHSRPSYPIYPTTPPPSPHPPGISVVGRSWDRDPTTDTNSFDTTNYCNRNRTRAHTRESYSNPCHHSVRCPIVSIVSQRSIRFRDHHESGFEWHHRRASPWPDATDDEQWKLNEDTIASKQSLDAHHYLILLIVHFIIASLYSSPLHLHSPRTCVSS